MGSIEIHNILPKESRELKTLPFADFAWLGRGPDNTTIPIGVERKTLGDLLNSMTSGRLVDHQLPGLLEHYEYVWIVVEGGYTANEKTGVLEEWGPLKSVFGTRKPGKKKIGMGWRPVMKGSQTFTYAGVENFLTSLTVGAGVHIKQTRYPEETRDWLLSQWAWWSKPWEQHHSLNQLHRVEIGGREPVTLVMRIAAQLPGVGSERARNVGKRFGSVVEMVGAGEKEWMEVEGIGKNIAKNLVKVIREKGVMR